MEPYKIGTEVFAVVMMPIEEEIEGINSKLQFNTVIKTKIKNFIEGDSESSVYEVENYDGSIKANKVYKDFNQAKNIAFELNEKNIKHESIKKVVKSKLDALKYTFGILDP
jgi:hypothetical protein